MYQIKCHFFQFSYKGQCIGLNFGGRTLHLSRNSALIAWSSSTSHLLRYKAMFSKTFESLRFSCCPQAYPVARVSRFCWQRNPAHGPPHSLVGLVLYGCELERRDSLCCWWGQQRVIGPTISPQRLLASGTIAQGVKTGNVCSQQKNRKVCIPYGSLCFRFHHSAACGVCFGV